MRMNKESLKEQGKKENIKYFFNRNRNFFFNHFDHYTVLKCSF